VSGSLERRLRALEDRAAIDRLFADYARHLDARDWHAYSRLFARDGEWTGGTGYAKGPDQIEAMLSERLGANAPPPGPTNYHLVGNPTVELDGDSATAESTWALIVRGEGDTPVLTYFGRYRDRLVREDGRWRFARREAHTEIPVRPITPDP
jgi:uncharacterized protein (TIGR02246 family)